MVEEALRINKTSEVFKTSEVCALPEIKFLVMDVLLWHTQREDNEVAKVGFTHGGLLTTS
jgi:hypothetical protein